MCFNRLSPDGNTQWNSFSAGGRDSNNAYYVDGAEYGHWDYYEGKEENYFHYGDIIYLDISEFTDWKKDGAILYVNFSDVSKQSNGGKDISINGNIANINPKDVSYEVNENIYAYAVNEEDVGKDILRFWRGNETTLWNCSITLSYEEYKEGKNSIKIKGWNEAGILCECQNGFDMSDNDDDGLPNFYEDLINADKNNSDGDGLSDGYELFTTLTNPTKVDTDDNGIDDGDEDFDKDKLSTFYEYELGINPKDKDTDGDGLGDYSELKYNMNPNDQDTLDDGLMDGDRIFEIVCKGDASDNEEIIPHISIELYGKQVDSLSITKIEDNDNFLNSSMPGYIANGYDFYVDGTFEEATLSFEVSESILNDEEIAPTIYYWNEEIQLLEEVENQYIDGNRVCVKLSHFSKYVLLDKNRYSREAFLCEIAAPSDTEYVNKKFDVAFVLDESGSISYGNFSTMKNQCSTLVEKFVEEDRVAVFTFDDAINEAVNEFVEASNEETTKIMVLLTDGYNNSSRVTLEIAIQNALDNNVVIYCIGIGSVNTSELSSISSRTGGIYYGLNSFSQLESAFNRLILETDLYKDSDNDGLSDYHEKKIASGEMCTGTGGSLKSCSTMNYLCDDSDGDGIIDGEEVEIRENTQGNYRLLLYSNPCLLDSDYDGYEDYIESYIGSPLLSKNNETMASLGSFKLNNWYDWKILIEEYAWNHIHTLVQDHIVAKYGDIKKEHVLKDRRIDLIRDNGEIWEVKPSSYSYEPNLSKGLTQLYGYRDAMLSARIGGSYIVDDSFSMGKYTIKYKNLQNGLIVYSFEKKKEQEQEQEETATVKEKGYVYEAKTEAAWNFFGAVAGVAIIVITVGEDVATLGAGIADDAASFTFAFSLIFGQ